MNLSFKQVSHLVSFIDKIEQDTYPEAPSKLHSDITSQTLDVILEHLTNKNIRILDIGCGQGPALDIFHTKGYNSATGITLNDEDVKICREKGHTVFKMDQSFLDFQNHSFDFIWARHVIEHSIFPYYTLTEYARVLTPGGMLYLEVPAPETCWHHEKNPNHYSVLSKNSWISLLERSGFSIDEEAKYSFMTQLGTDEYWGFTCYKHSN